MPVAPDDSPMRRRAVTDPRTRSSTASWRSTARTTGTRSTTSCTSASAGRCVPLAVILLPFRPLWSLGLFLGGYAFMFFGHFAFEQNIPTVLKHPTTPFVIAWAVIRGLGTGLVRLATPSRGR